MFFVKSLCFSIWKEKTLQTVIAFSNFPWVPLSWDYPNCWQELMSWQKLMFPPHAKILQNRWYTSPICFPIHPIPKKMTLINYFFTCPLEIPPTASWIPHPSTSDLYLSRPSWTTEIVQNHHLLLAFSYSTALAILCTLVEAVRSRFYSVGVPILPNAVQ